MDELDIRNSAEAREEKQMRHVEFEEIDDGQFRAVYECPVCDQTVKGGGGDHMHSPIGDYHTDHLSEGEQSHLRDLVDEDEKAFERAANAERSAKQSRAVYGDGYFSGQ